MEKQHPQDPIQLPTPAGETCEKASEKTPRKTTPPERESLDLAILITAYQKNVERFVMRRINNQADADDIVQATFLEALVHLDRYRGWSRPETWLIGIACNLISQHFAHSPQSRYVFEDIDLIAEELIGENLDPYQKVAEYELITQLLTHINEMPKESRITAQMAFVDGKSHDDIADALRTPVGTIRSRISRSRSELRKKLSGTHKNSTLNPDDEFAALDITHEAIAPDARTPSRGNDTDEEIF
jgi:RNA polymerase sigma factor (sigma-70 family)